jgi:hypothetical protein
MGIPPERMQSLGGGRHQRGGGCRRWWSPKEWVQSGRDQVRRRKVEEGLRREGDDGTPEGEGEEEDGRTYKSVRGGRKHGGEVEVEERRRWERGRGGESEEREECRRLVFNL